MAAQRINGLDWNGITGELDANGAAVIGPLLAPEECAVLVEAYGRPELFRSRVVMARHGFGRGEYQYFAAPLPSLVAELREALYARLAPVANAWAARLRLPAFPDRHADYLALCHAAGQTRPTPLLLRYGAGDYNCLHQDLYGDLAFPLQVAIVLDAPGRDFSGGEFVVTEQRPRMQSRVAVFNPGQGAAVVFAVNERPVAGARGDYRVRMRHGVSRLHSGQRHTLGVIFHDAR